MAFAKLLFAIALVVPALAAPLSEVHIRAPRLFYNLQHSPTGRGHRFPLRMELEQYCQRMLCSGICGLWLCARLLAVSHFIDMTLLKHLSWTVSTAMEHIQGDQ